MRWILLDEVVEICKGAFALTRSHVPEGPFSVEMILLEMMAQTGGLLLGSSHDFQNDIVFGKVEKSLFHGPFPKGAALEIKAVSTESRAEGAWFEASIHSSGKLLAESRFFLANAGLLLPERKSSVTFPEPFLNHFHVREKVKSSDSFSQGAP